MTKGLRRAQLCGRAETQSCALRKPFVKYVMGGSEPFPNSLITDSAAGMGVETEVGDALAGERLEVLGKIVLEAEKSHL